VHRRRSTLYECGAVDPSSIAFVLSESVPREPGIALRHPSITKDFGDDRGCRDRERAAVAAGDAKLRKRAIREWKVINDERLRRDSEGDDGSDHGAAIGLGDTSAIDNMVTCPANAYCQAVEKDDIEERFSLSGRQLLGITNAPKRSDRRRAVRRQNNGCSYQRAGPATPTDLVDTGNKPVAPLAK
jgi:hypothetical protein